MDLNRTVEEFELTSPFLDIEYRNIKVWEAILLAVCWLIAWLGIGVALIWAYAIWFPAQVGFQTALLVGVALLVLGQA